MIKVNKNLSISTLQPAIRPIRDIKKPYTFKTAEPIDVEYDDLIFNFKITIPINYKTDLASIPRIFWRIVPPHGIDLVAFVVHDYLYQYSPGKAQRVIYDKIMFELQKEIKTAKWRRWIIYISVRLFGYIFYKKIINLRK